MCHQWKLKPSPWIGLPLGLMWQENRVSRLVYWDSTVVNLGCKLNFPAGRAPIGVGAGGLPGPGSWFGVCVACKCTLYQYFIVQCVLASYCTLILEFGTWNKHFKWWCTGLINVAQLKIKPHFLKGPCQHGYQHAPLSRTRVHTALTVNGKSSSTEKRARVTKRKSY